MWHLQEECMGTQANLNINGIPAYAVAQPIEKGVLTQPFIILLLCMIPSIPYIGFVKPIVAVILMFITLTAVLGAFANKIWLPGRKIFLAFLLLTLLNIFICLAYKGPLLRWSRIAFCSYIFVAIIFYVVHRINTPNRRDLMWRLLVYFISCASLLDIITLARRGLTDTFEHRAAGGHEFTITALMLLFPIFGSSLKKKGMLTLLFFMNLFLLFLSSSRGVYAIIIVATIYSFIFIQKQFKYRLLFLISILMVSGVIISTPIYDRMTERFASVAEGDNSAWARVDEANSAIAFVSKSWPSLLFGKGYGIPWKPIYKLSQGRQAELPNGYMANAPHNDYAARILYCGLVGLLIQLLMYAVIGFSCVAALRRSRLRGVDASTKVRLHGALLVLMSMMMAGFAGGSFIFFNNNVYEAFIFGMAMADVTAVLYTKKEF